MMVRGSDVGTGVGDMVIVGRGVGAEVGSELVGLGVGTDDGAGVIVGSAVGSPVGAPVDSSPAQTSTVLPAPPDALTRPDGCVISHVISVSVPVT